MYNKVQNTSPIISVTGDYLHNFCSYLSGEICAIPPRCKTHVTAGIAAISSYDT